MVDYVGWVWGLFQEIWSSDRQASRRVMACTHPRPHTRTGHDGDEADHRPPQSIDQSIDRPRSHDRPPVLSLPPSPPPPLVVVVRSGGGAARPARACCRQMIRQPPHALDSPPLIALGCVCVCGQAASPSYGWCGWGHGVGGCGVNQSIRGAEIEEVSSRLASPAKANQSTQPQPRQASQSIDITTESNRIESSIDRDRFDRRWGVTSINHLVCVMHDIDVSSAVSFARSLTGRPRLERGTMHTRRTALLSLVVCGRRRVCVCARRLPS